MKMSLFLFFFTLLIVSRAEINILAQVEQHPFGSVLMDLVQVNMQSYAQTNTDQANTVSQIQSVLKDLSDDFDKTIKQANADHASYQLLCDKDIKSQAAEILKNQNTLKQTQLQLSKDKKSLSDAQSDLSSQKTHLANVISKIIKADAADKKAKIDYQNQVTDLNNALQATKDAQLELSKLKVGFFIQGVNVNFVQIQQGMKNIENTLKTHLRSRLSIYEPIVQVLTDIASSDQSTTGYDPKQVSRIVSLINDLQKSIQSELVTNQNVETQRQVDYKQTRQDLVDDQTKTQNKISDLNSSITNLQSQIKNQQSIIDSLTKIIPTQQKLLKDRQTQCSNESSQYKLDNKSRLDDKNVLNQLINYLNTRFSKFSDYVKNRTL